jgi:hypothetical protein
MRETLWKRSPSARDRDRPKMMDFSDREGGLGCIVKLWKPPQAAGRALEGAAAVKKNSATL